MSMDKKNKEYEMITKWIGENMDNLDVVDQLTVLQAYAKMVEDIKPIFVKYMLRGMNNE